MGQKRVKTDDSSSENSPSASTTTANEERDNSQLSEISAKLSIIISAINELTASIKKTNICSASVSNEATISEISKLIKNIDESVTKRTNPEMHMDNVEMQDKFSGGRSDKIKIKPIN